MALSFQKDIICLRINEIMCKAIKAKKRRVKASTPSHMLSFILGSFFFSFLLFSQIKP